MKIVAIVAEYNPFHYGHLYQIETIRKTFGEDTAIIAVMSGNYTQRGELALLNKVERAKCALACGVNLVLELPFPYSMSSAEHLPMPQSTLLILLELLIYYLLVVNVVLLKC